MQSHFNTTGRWAKWAAVLRAIGDQKLGIQRLLAAPLLLTICLACSASLSSIVCVMKIKGLPVIEVDESEQITVAVRADDLLEGDTTDPKQHPIAIALRRQDDVDDARVTKNETLVRRGKKWFRYGAPDRRLFKQLQKTLTAD